MFFSGADEDEDNDFTPSTSTGSKLSALFGGPSSKSSNLKYVAPKQPRSDSVGSSGEKSNPATSGQQQAPAVLMATAVHAYLYVSGVAQSHGRAMCCLLGNVADKNFQLLLYRSKQDHLTRAKIQQHFSFSVQPNNYANFSDDHQRSWSIMLDTGQYAEFVIQVGVCRALLELPGSSGQHLVQDVIVGEGPVLKEGDHTQVSYTTWSINNGKKGEQIEEAKSGQRVKLKEVSGSWEAGLQGAQKNGRRLIFVPSAKDSTAVIFHDITIERVKQKGGGDHSGRNTPQLDLQPHHKEITGSNRSLNMLPEDTENNLNDGGHVSKATLVSRMARMGHPLLPTSVNARHAPTDSESEVEEISRRRKQKHGSGFISGSVEELEATPAVRSRASSTRSDGMKPEPAPRPTHLSTQPQQLVVYQSPWHQHGMLPPGYAAVQPAVQPGAQTVMSAPQPPPVSTPDPTLSLLFSETRSQNTELKISVSKMSDKIDGLSSKIEKMEQQLQQGGLSQSAVVPARMVTPHFDYGHPTNVDAQAVLAQITTLVNDNEDMKARLEEKEKKITALNDSVTQMLHKNQKLLEEKTDMLMAKQQESSMTGGLAELLALRDEKSSITAQLGVAQAQLTTVKEEVSHSRNIIEKQEEEINNLKREVQEKQTKVSQLESTSQSQKSREMELDETLKNADLEKERLKSLVEAHDARKQTLEDEHEKLTEKKNELEKRLQAAESEQCSLKEKLQATLQQMEERTRGDGESSGEKDIENQLREDLQTKTSRVNQLEQEVTDLQSQCSEIKQEQTQQLNKYQAQLQKLEAEKEDLQKMCNEIKKLSSNPEEVVGTVKKVMNNVFRTLKPQFADEEMYAGAIVMQTLLAVIRDTTLQLLEDIDKKKKKGEVNISRLETTLNSQDDRGNDDAHDLGIVQTSENNVVCSENISGIEDSTCSASNHVENKCEDNSERNNYNDFGGDVHNEKLTKSIESGEEYGKEYRAENNSEKETEIEDFENKTEISSSDGEYADASDRDFSSHNSDSSSDSNSYDCEKSTNIISLDSGIEKEVAADIIQEIPVEDKAEASHINTDNSKRTPVIDMENTEVNSVSNEKSDRSRDSSLDRGWRPQPPPPPLFSDEEEDEDDDWLS